MKHKVSQLEGTLLDAAVARALGSPYAVVWNGDGPASAAQLDTLGVMHIPFRPSSQWHDGGTIISREGIALWSHNGEWRAAHPDVAEHGWYDQRYGVIDCADDDGLGGTTPLIAAMRAFVTSKFGDEIELP